MAELNPSYTTGRDDVASMVPFGLIRILDVGCSNGALGASLKERSEGVEVTGIEYDRDAASEALEKLDRVLVLDLNAADLSIDLEPGYFDCIVFGDVLEHLVDPWGALHTFSRYLQPGGYVVASLPNIRHIDTVLNLVVRGRWPYRERGIHDRTHLRFFTLTNIRDLFTGAGFEIREIRRNLRIIERPHRYNRFARLLDFWPIRDFFTFQYLIGATFEGMQGEI